MPDRIPAFLRRALFAVAIAVLTAPCSWAQAPVPGPGVPPLQTSEAQPTARVIVKYRADSPILLRRSLSPDEQGAARARDVGARIGLSLRSGRALGERAQVLFADGPTSEQLARRLAAEGDVEYAVPDERRHRLSVPNDPLYLTGAVLGAATGGPASGQWYLRAPAGDLKTAIDAESAWNVTRGSPDVVVAVIDTGVRFDHADFRPASAGGNLLAGYDMVSDASTANDGDGRDADASDPGDWLTLSEVTQRGSVFYQCDTSASDSSWHGTQVAGIIGAATDNGIGMASVAPDVRVLPVRVLGKCGGYDSDIIAAMRWAAGLAVPGVPANANPARVLNLSLGSEGACSAAYRDAVTAVSAAGSVVVAAAGNSTGHAVGAPANCPGVVAVAGLRHAGTKVGFSDLGPEIAISAPAGNCVNTAAGTPCLYPIVTTTNTGRTTPVSAADGGSAYTDAFDVSVGTSFATPLVSATAALMLSVAPSLSPAQVRALLQSTARPFPTTGGDNGDGSVVPQCTTPAPIGAAQVDQLQCYCTTATCGAGMLDASAAVNSALNAVAKASSGSVVDVIEYYDSAFDHYFITGLPNEIEKLDAGAFAGWIRTGQSFRAYSDAPSGSAAVCRFFSTAFGAQSSHFYTPDPGECALLQGNPGWQLEGVVFHVPVPDANGACPGGMRPVYRLYNDGQGGAPNHRYTTDLAVRAQMLARGWIPEGYGVGVVMCGI